MPASSFRADSSSRRRPFACRGPALAAWLLSAFAIGPAFAAGAESAAAARFRDRIEPILSEYCYACHAVGEKKGNVSFDTFESDEALLGSRELWWAVLKNVRAGVMPPAGKPRPSEREVARLAEWIKRDAFGVDPKYPDPGRVTLRRLNRNEYRNTIRDLMGYDFKALEEFPPDDTGYGFDNIGDVLSVSPLLLEKYMHAAESIVKGAVPTIDRTVPERTINGDRFREAGNGKKNGSRLTFYEETLLAFTQTADYTGDYHITLEVEVDGNFNFDPGRCNMIFAVGDQEKVRSEFGWHDSKRFRFEFDDTWQKGDQRLSMKLEPLVPVEEKKNSLDLRLVSVQIQGPFERKHWVRTRNYEKFFSRPEVPEGDTERRVYARELLGAFATKAFRRPVDATTLDRLVAIAEAGYERPNKRFEEGVAQAMTAVLASPRFLFRTEGTAGDDPTGKTAWVDDYALASRLSYFLWSTMPDAELLRLAEQGLLRERMVPQMRRMMADERSQQLVSNFVGQWLQSRDVEGISINSRVVLRRDGVFRMGNQEIFDGELRRSMRQETEMYVGHVISQDRSVLELLDSDYAFLNAKLATHYGIPGVTGQQLKQVKLDDDSPRGGILTQGTVLVVTSNPTRTSPVKRGLFILDNILGTPAPPPPPDVPDLETAEKEFKDHEPSMRELMELHRQKPLCASCHARMDPLGLSLENFNALGMFRDTDRKQPIETGGELLSGEKFENLREMKRVLAQERRGDFYRCLTEKLLTYALGRGLEYYDVPTVDGIVERLERDGGRFSTLLEGIVESAAFQKRRK